MKWKVDDKFDGPFMGFEGKLARHWKITQIFERGHEPCYQLKNQKGDTIEFSQTVMERYVCRNWLIPTSDNRFRSLDAEWVEL